MAKKKSHRHGAKRTSNKMPLRLLEKNLVRLNNTVKHRGGKSFDGHRRAKHRKSR